MNNNIDNTPYTINSNKSLDKPQKMGPIDQGTDQTVESGGGCTVEHNNISAPFSQYLAFKDTNKGDYPVDPTENLQKRLQIVQKASNNKEIQALIIKLCKSDILFWVNLFVYTYNPREENAKIPFITYKYQDEFIRNMADHIQHQKDILIDKSRDMGVSWCALVVYTWFWLFGGEGNDFLCGSRKEQYVDKIGDMDTLLQKIRFIIMNLPPWMKPKGFRIDKHATYMKIINPITNSVISGEATNANFSRGGRRKSIFFDEFAFWENDGAAWRSAADTTNCRIAVSTPNGFNNHFAKIRHSNSIDVVSLHWTLHPDKAQGAYLVDEKREIPNPHDEWKLGRHVSSPWYDDQVKRRNHDTVEISQELDISYEGSEEGVLYKWEDMNKAVKLDMPLSKSKVVLVFDPSSEGKDEAAIYVSNNGAIAQRKFIQKTTAEGLAAEIVGLAYRYKVQVIMGDAIGNDVLGIISVLLQNSNSKIKIAAFKSSEKAENTHKFFNRRAEAYYNAAQQMLAGNLQMDDDYKLMKQLSATKFTKKNGRILLISKEEIKTVCGSSPDRADAWMLIPEALKLTFDESEIEYRREYRRRINFDKKPQYHAYGDWGDVIR